MFLETFVVARGLTVFELQFFRKWADSQVGATPSFETMPSSFVDAGNKVSGDVSERLKRAVRPLRKEWVRSFLLGIEDIPSNLTALTSAAATPASTAARVSARASGC